jgi:hypothetical protein
MASAPCAPWPKSSGANQRPYDEGMLSLNDKQLGAVVAGAADLSPDKRAAYLERVAAHLSIRCGDGDVATAVQVARDGFVHK